MKIKAKFKGTDSLGYVNGENYWLFFGMTPALKQIWITQISDTTDNSIRNGSFCLYDSLKAFLNNWQVF